MFIFLLLALFQTPIQILSLILSRNQSRERLEKGVKQKRTNNYVKHHVSRFSTVSNRQILDNPKKIPRGFFFSEHVCFSFIVPLACWCIVRWCFVFYWLLLICNLSDKKEIELFQNSMHTRVWEKFWRLKKTLNTGGEFFSFTVENWNKWKKRWCDEIGNVSI